VIHHSLPGKYPDGYILQYTHQRRKAMIEHKHMKFMAITTILIILGFGLYLLVTAYLYA
jgi:hypothetical protein